LRSMMMWAIHESSIFAAAVSSPACLHRFTGLQISCYDILLLVATTDRSNRHPVSYHKTISLESYNPTTCMLYLPCTVLQLQGLGYTYSYAACSSCISVCWIRCA
jgi:hypothetical protein